jgi:hypothetical protein
MWFDELGVELGGGAENAARLYKQGSRELRSLLPCKADQ